MLVKLIKYDVKALFRVTIVLFPAIMLVGLVTGFTMSTGSNSQFVGAILTLLGSVVAFSGLTLITTIVTTITIVKHFNNNIFGPEGYLMNTLPVTAGQLLLSKLISALILLLASCVVMFISLALLFLGAEGFETMFEFILSLFDSFTLSYLWNLITLAAIVVSTILTFYCACSVGQLANDKRTLVSIGAFVGMYLARSIITTVISNIIASSLSNYSAIVNATTWLQFIMAVLCSVLYYFLTAYIMNKNLNLE